MVFNAAVPAWFAPITMILSLTFLYLPPWAQYAASTHTIILSLRCFWEVYTEKYRSQCLYILLQVFHSLVVKFRLVNFGVLQIFPPD